MFEALILGLFVGWLLGGKLSRLAKVELTGIELIIVSLIIQLFVPRVHIYNPNIAYWMHVCSYLLLFFTLAKNKFNPPITLMFSGIFLNFLVIGLNRGMPVSTTAIPATYNDGIHLALTSQTKLPYLADIISWPGPFGGLASIGDIFLSAGVFLLIINGMRKKPIKE